MTAHRTLNGLHLHPVGPWKSYADIQAMANASVAAEDVGKIAYRSSDQSWHLLSVIGSPPTWLSLGHPWKTYTTVLDTENADFVLGTGGTIVAQYIMIGNTIDIAILVTFGTGPDRGTGDFFVTLPAGLVLTPGDFAMTGMSFSHTDGGKLTSGVSPSYPGDDDNQIALAGFAMAASVGEVIAFRFTGIPVKYLPSA